MMPVCVVLLMVAIEGVLLLFANVNKTKVLFFFFLQPFPRKRRKVTADLCLSW
jgi:ABC-type uncharacterized transport system permease subunit